MLNYIEYLNMPVKITCTLVIIFFIIQAIGELLELKGLVVPEIVKLRKYFKRKKDERKIIAQVPETLAKVESLLSDVNEHYSKDNITKRNSWMDWVNERAKVYDAGIVDLERNMSILEKKVEDNNLIAISLLIEVKRNAIINFASKVIDEKFPVTREQFNRIFKIYEEYEDIIEKHELTNGEVDIAIRIIEESYAEHMKNHSFIENIRGYN